MKKILKRILISILSLISLVLIAILVIACLEKPIYHKFYQNVEESIAIRGLKTSYVPQGFCYYPEEKVYLTSGYMNDGAPSRIYLISEDETEEKYVTLLNEDGSDFFGHVGGVSAWNDHVILASDDYIYELSYQEIADAEDGKTVTIKNHYKTDLVPAFTFVNDGYLYVGEFYKEEKYETDPSHHLETPNGQINRALCYAYPLNEPLLFEPEFAISIPNMVQGMCISASGDIAISISWGISNSKLMIFHEWKVGTVTFNINDRDIPLYYLTEDNLKENISMPPMSEELDYHEGRIMINFESAGQKYRNFNIFRQEYILAYLYN